MNYHVELLALGIRLLTKKSKTRSKPNVARIAASIGGQSYDRRLAREILDGSEKIVTFAKRANTDRKFKQIIQNY